MTTLPIGQAAHGTRAWSEQLDLIFSAAQQSLVQLLDQSMPGCQRGSMSFHSTPILPLLQQSFQGVQHTLPTLL